MPNRRVAVDVSVRGSAFGREMAQMSAEATAAGAAVRSIPNEVTVRARSTGLDKLESDARRAERSSSALVDTAVAIWPALIPVTTLAVPALAGLAAQFTIGAGAAGVMVAAFHGVGDALKALDAAQLDPSTANLEKLDEAMSKLGPDGRAFVRELDDLEPALQALKRASEGGILPGATEGIDALLTRLPQVRRIVAEISGASGDLLGDAGRGLATSEMDDFFDYLEHEAKPILLDMGHTLGNFTAGFAHLLVDLAPAERDFSQFLLNSSRSFKDWTIGLDDSEGLRDLLDYIDDTGPEVGETLGAVASAFVAVARAGAPLSGPVLNGIETLADLVERIADSPIGTPLITLASGLALVNRALAVSALTKNSLVADLLYGRQLSGAGGGRGPNALARTSSGLATVGTRVRQVRTDVGVLGTTWATAGARSQREIARTSAASARLRSNLGGIGKGAAAVGALTLATSGLADGFELSNTASLTLAGSMAGPYGAAAGYAVGATLDLKAANDQLAAAVERGDAVFKDRNSTLAQQKAALADVKKQGALFDGGGLPNPIKDPLGAYKQAAGVLSGNASDLSNTYQAGIDRIRTDRAQRELEALRSRAILAGQGLNTTAAGARELGRSSEQMASDLNAGQAAIGRSSNLTAYKSAILDVRDAVRQNGATLDQNTRKGQANMGALQSFASKALTVANDLRGIRRVRFLDGARDQFIKAAVAAGATRAQARALAGQFKLLDLLHPKVKVTVDGVLTAKANVAQLQNAITGLHDKTVRINTVTTNSKTPMAQGYATGGLIYGPGGPREDRVPIWASNGEYVMNAAATKQFRNEIEWMNAQGLARGGFASAPPPQVRVSSPDLSGTVLSLADGVLEVPGFGEAILRGAKLVIRQEAGMAGSTTRSGPRS